VRLFVLLFIPLLLAGAWPSEPPPRVDLQPGDAMVVTCLAGELFVARTVSAANLICVEAVR
jgi:hypothetical protein